ncbi:hypothetical protein D0Y65_013260 [Glycine soja]|uniref:Uncharacterized protein n=1 Tax=Glycine soja TaxID=3848 RepID=A0A445KT69_GLYSO|nr:hypothetical protein D0Y65_013260 [Glycine soja]RZC14141.1 hypothetical protein D0Y65_013260 [Glycine soja]RZC14142.1 hypothetical protein D0Y65_013260 [Glycine soja]
MQIFNISTRYSWLELTAVYIVLFSSLPVLAFSLLDLSTLHSSFPISRLTILSKFQYFTLMS